MRRRRPRSSRLLLFLAIVLGASTTLVLRGHLARLEAGAAEPGNLRSVVVATADLPRGTELRADLLGMEEIPASYLPPGALGQVADAVGSVLVANVVTGEVITDARVAATGGPVAALIPPGLRAVPVTVSLPPGVVVPGDRVDVLATYSTSARTETVAAGIEVLSVIESGAGELGPQATVLLLVTPNAAEDLAHARAFADLSVAVAPS